MLLSIIYIISLLTSPKISWFSYYIVFFTLKILKPLIKNIEKKIINNIIKNKLKKLILAIIITIIQLANKAVIL